MSVPKILENLNTRNILRYIIINIHSKQRTARS